MDNKRRKNFTKYNDTDNVLLSRGVTFLLEESLFDETTSLGFLYETRRGGEKETTWLSNGD